MKRIGYEMKDEGVWNSIGNKFRAVSVVLSPP